MEMIPATIAYAILGAALAVVALVLYFAARHSDQVAEMIPPGIVARLFTVMDTVFAKGLTESAKTPDLGDDQLYITLLQIRGWTVTGSAETGYTLTPPSQSTPAIPPTTTIS